MTKILDKQRLDEIRGRVKNAPEKEWSEKYCSPGISKLFYTDIPELLESHEFLRGLTFGVLMDLEHLAKNGALPMELNETIQRIRNGLE